MARKKSGLSFYQKEKVINKALVREIIEMIIGSVIAVFLASVMVYCLGTATVVVGDSMAPALENGQTILLDRFSYMLSSPKRGDVVVFYPNGNENTHYYVKRIIGLPGETVQIREGHVYINGVYLTESDTFDVIEDPGIAGNVITLEPTQYFVLGDNRNSSEDSRSGNIGPISKEDIVGKAWFHMAGSSMGMGTVSR